MGFWHTGYEEFHSEPGLDKTYEPPKLFRHVCDQCKQQFDDVEQLRGHRFVQHPIRKPLLWLRGRKAGRSAIRISTPLTMDEVSIECATACRINGKSLTEQDALLELSRATNGVIDLELVASDLTSKYTIEFDISDERELRIADQNILNFVGGRELTVGAVSELIFSCASLSTVTGYVKGVCDYFYGTMAKERSAGTWLGAEEYVARYIQAKESLEGYATDFSKMIRSIVDFHFNHFETSELLAPDARVAGAFAGLLHGLPWSYVDRGAPNGGSALEAVFLDKDTMALLGVSDCDVTDLRGRSNFLLEIEEQFAENGYDRLKWTMLTAEALAMSDEAVARKKAIDLSRALAGNPDAKIWLSSLRDRLR